MAKTKSNKKASTISVYKKVFSTVQGQRVLYDLMNECNMMRPTAVKGDGRQSVLNEGKREAVLYILTKLNTDEKQLYDMIKKGEQDARTYADEWFS